MHDDVGDVAVDEHLAGREPDDLVGAARGCRSSRSRGTQGSAGRRGRRRTRGRPRCIAADQRAIALEELGEIGHAETLSNAGTRKSVQETRPNLHVLARFCLNRRMLTAERRHAILERLRSDGKVVAAELSAVARGLPGHGAARPARARRRGTAPARARRRASGPRSARSPTRRGASTRPTRRPRSRARQRPAAAGQVILLDSGTTTLEVARHLPPDLEATVITNSPPIAVALAEHPGVEVTVLGGQLDKEAVRSSAPRRSTRSARSAPTCSCSASAASTPTSGSPSTRSRSRT